MLRFVITASHVRQKYRYSDKKHYFYYNGILNVFVLNDNYTYINWRNYLDK